MHLRAPIYASAHTDGNWNRASYNLPEEFRPYTYPKKYNDQTNTIAEFIHNIHTNQKEEENSPFNIKPGGCSVTTVRGIETRSFYFGFRT